MNKLQFVSEAPTPTPQKSRLPIHAESGTKFNPAFHRGEREIIRAIAVLRHHQNCCEKANPPIPKNKAERLMEINLHLPSDRFGV